MTTRFVGVKNLNPRHAFHFLVALDTSVADQPSSKYHFFYFFGLVTLCARYAVHNIQNWDSLKGSLRCVCRTVISVGCSKQPNPQQWPSVVLYRHNNAHGHRTEAFAFSSNESTRCQILRRIPTMSPILPATPPILPMRYSQTLSTDERDAMRLILSQKRYGRFTMRSLLNQKFARGKMVLPTRSFSTNGRFGQLVNGSHMH